jgi:hypothetical protein
MAGLRGVKSCALGPARSACAGAGAGAGGGVPGQRGAARGRDGVSGNFPGFSCACRACDLQDSIAINDNFFNVTTAARGGYEKDPDRR